MTSPSRTLDAAVDAADVLRTVLETSGSVIIGLSPAQRVTIWNRAAEVAYGLSASEIVGQDFVSRCTVPAEREMVRAAIDEVLAGRRSLRFVCAVTSTDGRQCSLSWNVARLTCDDGTTHGVLMTAEDITQRAVAEHRLHLVFEHAQNGLLLADAQGVVVDCNPAALAMLGMTDRQQLLGRRPAEFSPVEQPDGQLSAVKSKVFGSETRERGGLTFEWTHQRVDGTTVPLEVGVKHAHVGDQQFSIVRWHDLTRQREMEAAREAMAQQLAHSQKLEAVGQLAGGIAHDFNNLLAGTRNALELMLPEVRDREQVSRDLRLALENIERAAGLTGQLLTMSRHQAVPAARVDWREAIVRAMPLLKSMSPPEVSWALEVPNDPVYVVANASQLDQLLLNLAINARDAMFAGGQAHIRLMPQDGVATLIVRDTGHGMDDATQRRIFEPFFTTKPVGHGSGLGLAVVYGLVTGWQGSVTVESVVGEGSTFRVTLPLAGAAAADDATILDAVPVVPSSRRRVLLVDDNEAVRTTTRRLLVRAGWVVDEAEDGEVAWERLTAAPTAYDIVLSDVRMPRLDGVRLVERMRRNQCDLPVVFMSGFDHIEYPFHHDVADVPLLPKPFTAETLTTMLARTLAATCHNP